MKNLAFLFTVLLSAAVVDAAAREIPRDVIKTSAGNLEISFIGHASLMLHFGGKIIHVDPYSKEGDYTQLPKADLILITHDHVDHYDPKALGSIQTDDTAMIIPMSCADRIPEGLVMKNGDTLTELGIEVRAVPAYNIVHKRENGEPYHPGGAGNGYVLTFGEKHIYIAGDTENTPEVKALRGIDLAFLPMNIPFTMTPAMVADAARAIKPKVLYPYHYGETDPTELSRLLHNTPGIEVRIRPMR